MTIFLEVAKVILKAEIDTLKQQSFADDKAWTNRFFTALGAGRDRTLSSNKRKLLNTLLDQITSMQPNENDMQASALLQQLLIECRSAGKSLSDKEGYDEGRFGPALGEMVNSIVTFYHNMQNSKLLNIHHDEDPFNIFRYFAALYASKEVIENYNDGFINRLLKHPKISAARALAATKIQAVYSALDECERDLEVLDPQHPRYTEARKKQVLASVANLENKNTELCQAYRTTDLGSLGVCLAQAKAEINGEKTLAAEAAAADTEETDTPAAAAQP